MRGYHFICEEYGLEDLKRRHLKIAILKELNDPFELFGINLSDKTLRNKFKELKDEISAKCGLLCFSRGWQNPVLWSHYAEKHQGLCLGFEISDGLLGKVSYSYSRKILLWETEQLLLKNQLGIANIKKFLLTKYAHWRYEDEVRLLVDLEENLRFVNFSEDLKLTQVIVGAESTLTRTQLYTALGDLVPEVEIYKARLAFKTFKVVCQRN